LTQCFPSLLMYSPHSIIADIQQIFLLKTQLANKNYFLQRSNNKETKAPYFETKHALILYQNIVIWVENSVIFFLLCYLTCLSQWVIFNAYNNQVGGDHQSLSKYNKDKLCFVFVSNFIWGLVSILQSFIAHTSLSIFQSVSMENKPFKCISNNFIGKRNAI